MFSTRQLSALALAVLDPLGGCRPADGRSNPDEPNLLPAFATLVPRPVLLTQAGTTIYNGGFGSALARHPTDSTRVYLLTDRGPNFEMPEEDHKTFPIPGYAPRIGLFVLRDSVLQLERTIELRDGSGAALTGIPNPPGHGGTGEIPLDSTGRILPFDSSGVDSEGLAALNDSTFWVSDEYGPSLLHLDAGGRTLERISPYSTGRTLPAVFRRRRPNKGIEGLAITPDQTTLVAVLEMPLDNPKPAGRVSRINRILTLDLASGRIRQFPYVVERAGLTTNGITAISGSQLLILERDDKLPGDSADPSAFKRIYQVDLTGATDVSDSANRPAGRLFGGKTLEELTPEELVTNQVVPVSKTLVADLLAPELHYPHNKPEGIAIVDRFTIAVSNDDDFGITDDGSGGIFPKLLPLIGQPDQTTVRFLRLNQPLY